MQIDLAFVVDLEELAVEVHIDETRLADGRCRREALRHRPITMFGCSDDTALEFLPACVDSRQDEFLGRTAKSRDVAVFVDDGLTNEENAELVGLGEGFADATKLPLHSHIHQPAS